MQEVDHREGVGFTAAHRANRLNEPPSRAATRWNSTCICMLPSRASSIRVAPRPATSTHRKPMTHPREPEPLRPMLRTAESQLVERIEEVCAHDVKGESTAELMRLEESLSDAARAAKQAVSLRRRLRTGHGASDAAHADAAPEASAPDAPPTMAERRAATSDLAAPSLGDDESAVREFLDRRGVTWRVWAVTQEQMHPERLIVDQMGEYRHGWLAFESTEGSERRRLPHYPPNWRRLSNLDLEGLLERAESVRRRRSPDEEADTTLL